MVYFKGVLCSMQIYFQILNLEKNQTSDLAMSVSLAFLHVST